MMSAYKIHAHRVVQKHTIKNSKHRVSAVCDRGANKYHCPRPSYYESFLV